jgi:hypothetical protein
MFTVLHFIYLKIGFSLKKMNLSLDRQSFFGTRGFSSALGSMDTARNSGLTLGNTGRNMSLSGRAINKTVNTHILSTKTSKISPVKPPNKNILSNVSVAVLNDEDMTQTLKELLTENRMLIRYKKGDEIVTRMKKVFKLAHLQKNVKFRSDKKIKWSPQYFINDDLSNLKGFMGAELLRLNIIAQLQDWEESESDFDDRSASESEEEVEIEDNESENHDIEGHEDTEIVQDEVTAVINEEEIVQDEVTAVINEEEIVQDEVGSDEDSSNAELSDV